MSNNNDKRGKILHTALQLFMKHGYRAVSIDRIAEVAGTTKMTVYRYFSSKDILIEAVLTERDRRFREDLEDYLSNKPQGLDKIQAVFDWYHQWFQENTFRGCMFINAIAEFSGEKASIIHLTQHHKRMIGKLLQHHLSALTDKDKAITLAAQLNELLDGAIVSAQIGNREQSAATAWSMAEKLIKPEMS